MEAWQVTREWSSPQSRGVPPGYHTAEPLFRSSRPTVQGMVTVTETADVRVAQYKVWVQ